MVHMYLYLVIMMFINQKMVILITHVIVKKKQENGLTHIMDLNLQIIFKKQLLL